MAKAGTFESNQSLDDELLVKALLKDKDGNPLPEFAIVRKIRDNLFAIAMDGKNVNSYVDSTGFPIIAVSSIAGGTYFDKAKSYAGYFEKELPNGEFQMSKKGSKEVIDKFSEAYFNAWIDIDFYEQYVYNYSVMLLSNHIIDKEYLFPNISSGAMRLNHLIILNENKKLAITKLEFNKLVGILRGKLLSQIGDSRFDVLNDPVTKGELIYYKENGYINQDLYELCLAKLLEINELKKVTAKKGGKIVKGELDGLKTGVINKSK